MKGLQMDHTEASSSAGLSDWDFESIAKFVNTHYGIDLSQKRRLIEARLGGEIKRLGFKSFKEYISFLELNPKSDKLESFIDKITTNYTFFNREMDHYDFLMKTIIPDLRASNRNTINIWSAGCATGEEPYNIAMAVDSVLGYKKSIWNTSVAASDISTRALSIARKGVYPAAELKGMPEDWKNAYMTELPDGNYKINENIRKSVFFSKLNLMDPFPPRVYDVIFCRNVMIYFKQPTSREVLKKFHNSLAEGGYLFIGHSETIAGIMNEFKYVQPSIYQKVSK